MDLQHFIYGIFMEVLFKVMNSPVNAFGDGRPWLINAWTKVW